MVNIPVIAHFAAATFFGNVAFSAMGFGMAICYLFVYQIGALAGLTECCGLPGLKQAVFIQTIGMTVIQPIVLWKVNLRQNFRWDLILTMVPMQMIGAPLGQILQAYTPSEVLKIIVGVVTILVAGWQAFNLWRAWRAARATNSYKMVEVTTENGTNGDHAGNVFLLAGARESERVWLQGLIGDRNPHIAFPPSLNILEHFTPLLPSYGDLNKDESFTSLVESVCQFVDASSEPLGLVPGAIAQVCGDQRTLPAVMEAVMDRYTEARNARTWLCVEAGEHHEALTSHFGSRLKYIHLVRDPRELCHNSNSDLYGVADTWSRLQRAATSLPSAHVYTLHYAAVIEDKDSQVEQLEEFLTGHSVKKSGNKPVSWNGQLADDKLHTVEALCYMEMKSLGFKPKSKKKPKLERRGDEEELNLTDKQRAILNNLTSDTVVVAVSNTDQNGLLPGQRKPHVDNKTKVKRVFKNISQELWPIRPVIVWMCVCGLLSGFLAGLIGVRSPPLIIFFFLYEFPPVQVKANGAVIAAVNTVVRIITYVCNPPPEEYGSASWFIAEDIWLYVVVAVVAITASPVGLYFTKYLNKSGYKVGLTALLIVNGVTMITTALLDLI